MPKIIRFHEAGGPEVLKFGDETSKQPGKGEARLRVQAVGLNRAEALFIRGQYLETPKLPAGIGYEAAGVVEAVGPDVDKAWIGKRVATIPAFSMNDYAMLGEEVIAPAGALAEYPAKLSPVEGAAIWMQYLTAFAAIEIANAEGPISIATTRKSNKKAELLSVGADHVIATEEEDLVNRVKEITAGKGARLIFDAVAGPLLGEASRGGCNGRDRH